VKKYFYALFTVILTLNLQYIIAADFAVVKNQRFDLTEEASKNLRYFNSTSVCQNWKDAFMESIIGKSFKSAEEKREATIQAEKVLSEITKMWNTLFSEDSKGPAHQEIFLLSSLKKDTNESYKKFYERRYNEHIEALGKVKGQFDQASSDAFKDVNNEYKAEFDKRIAMASFLKTYATSANKPVDAKKAAWALVLSEMQIANPEMDQKLLASVVVGTSSFKESPEKLCPPETVRRAIPIKDIHVEVKPTKKESN